MKCSYSLLFGAKCVQYELFGNHLNHFAAVAKVFFIPEVVRTE